MRGSAAAVSCPNVPDVMFMLAPTVPAPDVPNPRVVWLMMLNPSARACNVIRSFSLKRRESETSKLTVPGPRSVSRPRLPYVPVGFAAKAAGFSHCSEGPIVPLYTAPGKTRLGRSVTGFIAVSELSFPLFTVSGATSGAPLTVNSGKDNSLTAMNPVTDRPNLVLPGAVYNGTIGPSLQWLNPAAFAANPTGTYGNLGRDTLRGPATVNFDVSLSRRFKLKERITLQARAEGFNIINHTNLGFGTSGAGTVGASMNITSGTFGQLTAAADPRILQFALKLMF